MSDCTPLQKTITSYRRSYFNSRRKLQELIPFVKKTYEELKRLILVARITKVVIPNIVFPDVTLYLDDFLDNVPLDTNKDATEMNTLIQGVLNKVIHDVDEASAVSARRTVEYHLDEAFMNHPNLRLAIETMDTCPPTPEVTSAAETDLENLRIRAENAFNEVHKWKTVMNRIASLLTSLSTWIVANPSILLKNQYTSFKQEETEEGEGEEEEEAEEVEDEAQEFSTRHKPKRKHMVREAVQTRIMINVDTEPISRLDLTLIALFFAPLVCKNAIKATFTVDLSEGARAYTSGISPWKLLDAICIIPGPTPLRTFITIVKYFFTAHEVWFKRGLLNETILSENEKVQMLPKETLTRHPHKVLEFHKNSVGTLKDLRVFRYSTIFMQILMDFFHKKTEREILMNSLRIPNGVVDHLTVYEFFMLSERIDARITLPEECAGDIRLEVLADAIEFASEDLDTAPLIEIFPIRFLVAYALKFI